LYSLRVDLLSLLSLFFVFLTALSCAILSVTIRILENILQGGLEYLDVLGTPAIILFPRDRLPMLLKDCLSTHS
jgi:hypothetical protein